MVMKEMQNKSKKIAAAILCVSVIAAGAVYACGKTAEQSQSSIGTRPEYVSDQGKSQEKPEKQRRFEEHLAQKEAEFRRNHDEIKRQNDAMRKEFEQCREVSREELRELLAKERSKRMGK